jgi:Transposase IS4
LTTHIFLGTEFKNVACSVTGCIVGLELQRGKEGMRAGEYCDSLGATAACTLRLAELSLIGNTNSGLMGDAWFGSVKAATALAKKGYKAILQIKTGHSLFPKQFIEDALKDAPGGVWIVLESTHQNVPLVAIGYRYSTRTTLFFVATKDAGTTKKGNSYEMKYTDDWGNVHVRYVDRPEIISKFFERSNMIDKHNQVRQSELALEKRWLTQNPYFRLHTTILGFTVVDCYKLAEHHDIINHRLPHNEFKMTMTSFAGVLANQLINNVDRLLSFFSPMSQELRSLTETPANITVSNESQESISTTSTITEEQIALSIRVLTDSNGQEHHQIAYEIGIGRNGKKRTKTRTCSLCFKEKKIRRLVRFGCYTCGIGLCCPTNQNLDRDCFTNHVQSICRRSDRQT